MTHATDRLGDRKRLERALERFELKGAQSSDGRFLAYSETEPLFCYERNTEEEILQVISETLQSYIELFYGVDDCTVRITTEPIAASAFRNRATVPIENVAPTSRLLPSLSYATA